MINYIRELFFYLLLNSIIDDKQNVCIDYYLPLLPDVVFIYGIILLIIFYLYKPLNIKFLCYYILLLQISTFIALSIIYWYLNYGYFFEYTNNLGTTIQYFSGNYVINSDIILLKLIIIFFGFLFFLIKSINLYSINKYYLQLNTFCLNNKLISLYSIIFNLAIYAVLTFISSNNFILAYITLEFFSLCSSILITYSSKIDYLYVKTKHIFTNSLLCSLNYIIMSTLGSSVFLLGVVYIYGYSSMLNFNLLYLFLLLEDFDMLLYNFNQLSLVLSFLLVVLGLTLKCGLVPFYFWIYEIYKQLPYFILLYFLLFSKFLIFVFFYKLIFMFHHYIFTFIMVILGFSNIIIGSLLILKESDLKKILVGSSLSNAGYIILTITYINIFNFQTLVVFIFFYYLNLIGCFYILILNSHITRISLLRYIPNHQKIAFFFFLLSFIGIPFISGFWWKLLMLVLYSPTNIPILWANFIFNKIFNFFIVFILFINCISLIYYLNLIVTLIFHENKNKEIKLVNNYLFLYKLYQEIFLFLKFKNVKLYEFNNSYESILLSLILFLNLFMMLTILIF